MKWSVGSLNNEISHGSCLRKVELHGFASNGTFLQPPDTANPSPNGGKRKIQGESFWDCFEYGREALFVTGQRLLLKDQRNF